MKTYIKHSFISKLPLFIIIIAILVTIALASTGGYNFSYPEDFTAPYSAAVIVIAIVLPLFGMSYRYSLKKSDLYRQVAFKEKHIRIADNLVLIGTLLLSFIVTFPILSFTALIKNYITVGHEIMYYVYLIPEFFYLFFAIILTYGFSYCIVSLGNNVFNSIILLVLVQFTFFVFFGLIGAFMSPRSNEFRSSCVPFIIPDYVCAKIFGNLLMEDTVNLSNVFDAPYYETQQLAAEITVFIISILAFLIISIVGLVKLFAFKDPSSEWAGKPAYQNILPSFLYHGTFIIGISYFASTLHFMNPLSFLLILILMIALYYTLYGLMRMNFKVDKKDLLILGSSLASSFVLGVITFFTTMPAFN